MKKKNKEKKQTNLGPPAAPEPKPGQMPEISREVLFNRVIDKEREILMVHSMYEGQLKKADAEIKKLQAALADAGKAPPAK